MNKLNFKEMMDKIKIDNSQRLITVADFIDYDSLYEESLDKGFGFIIDENINYNSYLEKSTIEEIREMNYLNSIYSYKYGIDISDEEKVLNLLYQCECGACNGIDNKGFVCAECGTEVTRTDEKRIGWLVLDNIETVDENGIKRLVGPKIIHPFILFMFAREKSPFKRQTRIRNNTPIHESELKENATDSDYEIRNIIEERGEEFIDELEDELYEGLTDDTEEGMDEFLNEIVEEEIAPDISLKKKKKDDNTEAKEEEPVDQEEAAVRRMTNNKVKQGTAYTILEALNANKLDYSWEDILDYNSNNLEYFIAKYMRSNREFLTMYKDRWYTNKIPVISKNYRFIRMMHIEAVNKNDIATNPLNTDYQEISANVKFFNTESYNAAKMELSNRLRTICNKVSHIGTIIFNEVGHNKKSFIRSEIYGKTFTNSGRLVIEPVLDPNVKSIDECQVSIDYFRSTFTKDISDICKRLKISPKRIKNLININYTLTKEDKELIREKIFPKVKEPVLFTTREPGIYIESILAFRIHSLLDEMILRIPFFCLPSMNADFDGDVLTCITWLLPEERKRIEETLGVKKSLINTLDVSYNGGIGPNNNTAVLLYKGMSQDIKLKKKGKVK